MEDGMNAAVIEGLRVSHGRQHVLKDVDLTVRPGEIWALMGVSGAGKSTLMRCVVALQAFDAGRISLGDVALRPGRVPPESALKPLRRRVGMVFQSHALFDHLTVRDNITLAPVHAAGVAASRAQAIALEWLTSLGVAHRIDAFPAQLSGGEAQRVAIARALALDPGLLLMDEPTAALDPARRGALGETLGTLAAGGRGLLIATHDIEFAVQWSHRVAVLAAGEIVETGPSREVLTSPRHAATRELLRHSERA